MAKFEFNQSTKAHEILVWLFIGFIIVTAGMTWLALIKICWFVITHF